MGAEEGSGRDFPILWLGSGGWSKFLITTAWRTSKFIAAMKISILTCDLLTCWELRRHHHCQQRHTLSAGKIWGVNNVYRFIGNSKVYHWRPKWGSDCSLLGEIRSLGKLGAIGSHWETPLHSFHQTIALRSMCFWCILLFRKKTPNANYTFWKIKHKKYFLSKIFCTTLIKEEKFSNDAAHF